LSNPANTQTDTDTGENITSLADVMTVHEGLAYTAACAYRRCD